MPALRSSVQAILGHTHVDTTLGYARLYDGTVAADYYRAMSQIEGRPHPREPSPQSQPEPGYLLALADALYRGALHDAQRETLHALRAGIVALTTAPKPRETAALHSVSPVECPRPARAVKPVAATNGPFVLSCQ